MKFHGLSVRSENLACAAALSCGLMLTGVVQAQDAAADFYRGKTVNIIIGTSPGGGYVSYGRLVARHIGKHIPGNPTVVASNMSGAGSLVLTQHIANAAAKDGTIIGAVYPSVVTEPLYGDRTKLRYDATTLQYIGSANSEVYVAQSPGQSQHQGFRGFPYAWTDPRRQRGGQIDPRVSGASDERPRCEVQDGQRLSGRRGNFPRVEKNDVQGPLRRWLLHHSWWRPQLLRDVIVPRNLILSNQTTGARHGKSSRVVLLILRPHRAMAQPSPKARARLARRSTSSACRKQFAEEVARTAHFKLEQARPSPGSRIWNTTTPSSLAQARVRPHISQMAAFLDQAGGLWMRGALNGKVGGAFTSTATQHGEQGRHCSRSSRTSCISA